MPIRWMPAALLATAALLAPATALGARDYTRKAYDVMPPGQAGAIPPIGNSTDQLRLYDGLTPLLGNVSAADVRRYFKPELFGRPDGRARRERIPMRGIKLVRDKWDVPHVTAGTRAKVLFAAGWVSAEDRGVLMEAIRGPGKVAAVDAPGLDPFALATSLRSFTPSSQTQSFIDAQIAKLRRAGRAGRQAIKDGNAYVAGINAYYRKSKSSAKPWTLADVVGVGALIGAKFGKDGGDEARRSEFLSQLEARLGAQQGLATFRDLSTADDPESDVSVPGRFPYMGNPTGATPGSPPIDAGSLSADADHNSGVSARTVSQMSSALLVGAKRSADGHPLAVMGPQTGYLYPNIFLEVDLHGGGVQVRGAMLPGLLYPVIGRGPDFAWSITSADSDNTDQFLEELCNADGSPATADSTGYMYRGHCVQMKPWNAGELGASSTQPARPVTFRTTVHGPVSGTATAGGKLYAIANDRSTYGRDVLSVLGLQDLDTGKVRSPKTFIKAVSKIDFTFNWHYLDSKHIAFFSSGRLPKRAPGVDPRLATLGTGQYDWRGFLTPKQHPQAIDPGEGEIVNWNNRPAHGFGTADNEWDSWGSVDRAELYAGLKKKGNRLNDAVGVMNNASTQDARVMLVWPTISRLLATGAPDAQTQQAKTLLDAWVANGGHRIDADSDGKIDAPGAAIMDAAWPRFARAEFDSALGTDLTDRLAALTHIDSNAPEINKGATSNYGHGWYSYLQKDIRRQLGEPVSGPFSRGYCGGGDVNACRAAMWAALKAAVDELAAAQGPDPAAWRQDAGPERIIFQPGLLGPTKTIRWTNRPSAFQQVVEFTGHR
jgi:acyl-homoserine lactone acylase PvdQ